MHRLSRIRLAWARGWAIHPPRSRGAVILMYHGVVERERDAVLDEYSVPVAVLREHLRFLRRHREVVPLSRLVETLRAGVEPDARWVALTFDDALKNQFTRAAPLLAEYNCPWALAVPVGLIGGGRSVWSYELALLSRLEGRERPDPAVRQQLQAARPAERAQWMEERIAAFGRDRFLEQLRAFGEYDLADWSELRTLADAGVEILSHGATHAPFSSAWTAEDERAELAAARETLETRLGRPVSGFAAPHSVAPPELTAALARAGYEYALTGAAQPVKPGASLLALPRYDAAYPLPVLRRYCLG